MAKAIYDTTKERSGSSPFGSSSKMVTEEMKLKYPDKYVLLKDEMGFYITEKKNLDNGVADPYRYASKEYRDNMLLDNVVPNKELEQ